MGEGLFSLQFRNFHRSSVSLRMTSQTKAGTSSKKKKRFGGRRAADVGKSHPGLCWTGPSLPGLCHLRAHARFSALCLFTCPPTFQTWAGPGAWVRIHSALQGWGAPWFSSCSQGGSEVEWRATLVCKLHFCCGQNT